MDPARYFEQAIPLPVAVLGQQLQPFSLGHYKILVRFGNAFFVRDEKPNLGDLIFAVFICCQTYEEAITSLYSEDLDAKLMKWGRMLKKRKVDINEHTEAFGKYITDGSMPPDVTAHGNSGNKLGAPFIQQVQLTLQSKLAHTLSQALNKPWGEALHDYYAWHESEERCHIKGEGEGASETVFDEHLKAAKELIAEIQASRGGSNGV